MVVFRARLNKIAAALPLVLIDIGIPLLLDSAVLSAPSSMAITDTNPGVAMWTPTTRKQHIRETDRYQTDVTDKEWRVIEPHLPAAKSTGRPRTWPMREIINGIFYVMRSGSPWRLLPSDLPPWSTIYRWFATFRSEDRFEKINHALVMGIPVMADRHSI